jgi:hypothetical protein
MRLTIIYHYIESIVCRLGDGDTINLLIEIIAQTNSTGINMYHTIHNNTVVFQKHIARSSTESASNFPYMTYTEPQTLD